jgi:hypothetical protein
MKKTLLFCLIFNTNFLFAQTNDPFVEVIAEDTIHLEADEITFTINFLNEEYGTTVDSVETTDPDTKRTPMENNEKNDSYRQLSALLKQLHIDTLKSEDLLIKPEERYNRFIRNSLRLRFYSKADLALFLSKAKEIKNIVGFISDATSKKEKEGEQRLYKKILAKAKEDANNIASFSNKNVGKLLQVKQLEELPGGWTSYPPLSALGQAGEMLETVYPDMINGIIVLRKRISVRYEWH